MTRAGSNALLALFLAAKGETAMTQRLDGKDLAIIGELENNSRVSIRDIAKATQIRPSTVHVRISRLLEKGIIERFTLKLNHSLFGDNFVVFMLICTNEDLDKTFLGQEEVKEVYGVTGEFDLLVKLRFRDVDHFNRFLIGFRNDRRITKTVTMVGTIAVKE